MKKFFYLWIFIPFIVSAQTLIKGRITDAETGEALPFANIYVDRYNAVISDYEGNFRLNVPAGSDMFFVSYLGYETLSIRLEKEKNFYHVKLYPTAEQLNAVQIGAGYVPPEIKLLRKAVSEKKNNNYLHRLKKFAYTKYIKMLVTADPDEIDIAFDTIRIFTKNFDTIIIDSSLYMLKQDVKDKHLWLYQALVRVNGLHGKEKSKVIALRTAGLKKPLHELVALQVSNINLYDDHYRFIFSEYLGPFSKSSEQFYEYEIEDTLKIQDREVIALAYRKTGTPPVVGIIYLDKETMGIARMTLNTYKQIQMNADYRFKFYPEKKVWFPHEVKINLKIVDPDNPFIPLPDLEPDTLSVRNGDTIRKHHSTDKRPLQYIKTLYLLKISDVRLNDNYPEKIRYHTEVDPKAHKRDTSFWRQYTGENRDSKELNTYRFVDSIALKENIEFKINRKKKFFYGYIPVLPWIDLDFLSLLNYNLHEGLRLNLHVQTSEYFSEPFQISAYTGYGFKDKTLKYGGKLRYRLSYPTQTYLYAEYRNDISKASAFSPLSDGRNLNASYAYLADDMFYAEEGLSIGISHLLSSTLKAEVIWTQSQTKPLYSIQNNRTFFGRMQYLRTAVLWTPFAEYQLTPLGRLRLKRGYPLFYFTWEKLLKSQDIPSYYRTDFQVIVKKNYPNGDFSNLVFRTAYASQGAPHYKLYAPPTNNPQGNTPWKRFTLVEDFSFETMYDLEFSDNFLTTLHVAHTFTGIKIFRNNKMNIRLSGSIAYGYTEPGQFNPSLSLHKGFYETGITFQNLLSSFGLGLYYRLGPYRFSHPAGNVSVRLTLSSLNLVTLFSLEKDSKEN